eukprot:TRINITY_DN44274_c0_g1_i2.p1 TRINITY_DN44274_c0_g1~~TRINITY_DN44274_c0_g1_i2.p1  ORF type:complete len:525 (+),score=90.30 TRINITY_DN44274_c0_g1_i2:51-1625(+)
MSKVREDCPNLQDHFASVVKIEVTGASIDWLQPWRVGNQKEWGGSGFAIGGRQILTNHHVISEATDIRVRKNGSSKRFLARTLCSSVELDLGIIEVVEEEEEFWRGVKEIKFATMLPLLQERVTVVGYPTGGSTVCVTEGVISRVDCKNYNISNSSKHCSGNLLVVQIDAAINPGNSGGPCFDHNGAVTGVAFQGLSGDNLDNIGYLVPSALVQAFLHGIKRNGRFSGVPQVPFHWHNLHNKSLRLSLKVPEGMSGVVVTDCSPLAQTKAGGQLFQKDDVILSIDGHTLGDDFTVTLRNDELVHAAFLITGKRAGQDTKFSVLREAKKVELKAQLGPLPPPIPRFPGEKDQFGLQPAWVIIGGLVMVPLSCPMFGSTRKEWSAIWKMCGGPSANIQDLLNNPGFVRPGEESQQRVVMIQILKSDLNYGYQVKRWSLLESLNGKSIESLSELAKTYKRCQEDGDNWLKFKFEGGFSVVLETALCASTDLELQEQHKIPGWASADVLEELQSEASVPKPKRRKSKR